MEEVGSTSEHILIFLIIVPVVPISLTQFWRFWGDSEVAWLWPNEIWLLCMNLINNENDKAKSATSLTRAWWPCKQFCTVRLWWFTYVKAFGCHKVSNFGVQKDSCENKAQRSSASCMCWTLWTHPQRFKIRNRFAKWLDPRSSASRPDLRVMARPSACNGQSFKKVMLYQFAKGPSCVMFQISTTSFIVGIHEHDWTWLNMGPHVTWCEMMRVVFHCLNFDLWVPSLSANTPRRRAWRGVCCWAMCSAGSTDSTCSNLVQSVFNGFQTVPKRISIQKKKTIPKCQTFFNHALTQLQT